MRSTRRLILFAAFAVTVAPNGIPTDLGNTPEFTPGLTTYELPPSGVDPGGVVSCG